MMFIISLLIIPKLHVCKFTHLLFSIILDDVIGIALSINFNVAPHDGSVMPNIWGQNSSKGSKFLLTVCWSFRKVIVRKNLFNWVKYTATEIHLSKSYLLQP